MKAFLIKFGSLSVLWLLFWAAVDEPWPFWRVFLVVVIVALIGAHREYFRETHL